MNVSCFNLSENAGYIFRDKKTIFELPKPCFKNEGDCDFFHCMKFLSCFGPLFKVSAWKIPK